MMKKLSKSEATNPAFVGAFFKASYCNVLNFSANFSHVTPPVGKFKGNLQLGKKEQRK